MVVVGMILFLYLTWRNLREDYKEDELVSFSWLALLAMFLGGRLLYGLLNWGVWNDNWMDWINIFQNPGFNYIGAGAFLIIQTIWYCEVNEWKLWAFFEDITPIFLVMIMFFLGEESIKSHFNRMVVAELVIIIVGFLVNSWAVTKYRSWVWYKSGRKGFGFFFTGFLVFWLMAGVGLYLKGSLIIEVLEFILSLIFAVGLFILGKVL